MKVDRNKFFGHLWLRSRMQKSSSSSVNIIKHSFLNTIHSAFVLTFISLFCSVCRFTLKNIPIYQHTIELFVSNVCWALLIQSLPHTIGKYFNRKSNVKCKQNTLYNNRECSWTKAHRKTNCLFLKPGECLNPQKPNFSSVLMTIKLSCPIHFQ